MARDSSLLYTNCARVEKVLNIMALPEQFLQKFNAFSNFFLLTENSNWCVDINHEVVTNMFKEANMLETFCLRLEEQKLSEDYFKALTKHFVLSGFTFPGVDFFKRACDVLLSKFLTDSRLSDYVVKISVEQYCNNCSDLRFKTVIQHLISTRNAYLELLNVVTTECKHETIEAQFIYESWCKRLKYRNENLVLLDESVMKMLHSQEKSIEILFHILCIKDESEICKQIKRCIVSKLTSSSALTNKIIWQCFINLSFDNLKFIVDNFSNLLDSLFDVVTIASKNFYCAYTNNKLVWLPNSSDTISFSEIVILLNLLYNIAGTPHERVVNYFNSKKNSNQCLFFDDIESQVCKKNTAEECE